MIYRLLNWNTKGGNKPSGGTKDYEKVLYYPYTGSVIFLERIV